MHGRKLGKQSTSQSFDILESQHCVYSSLFTVKFPTPEVSSLLQHLMNAECSFNSCSISHKCSRASRGAFLI